MEIYIPWKVRLAAYRCYQWLLCLLTGWTRNNPAGLKISFYCNYHQITGATVAIASIANHLSETHAVDVLVLPQSSYSRLLKLSVRQTFAPKSLQGDVIFVDIEQENAVLEQLRQQNRHVAITCHALPTELHAVPQPKLKRNMELCSSIHFVSEFQQSEFIRHFPDIDISAKSFVIPNYTRESSKQTTTGSIGLIGYLNRPEKNALKGIQLAQQSNAKSIECWGSPEVAGIPNLADFPKLRLNGWSNSTREMHASFDVLVSASLYETFGLVVSEALSAGIPCALSDIPVFRSLYSECTGVVMLSGDDSRDIAAINRLLGDAAALKSEIIEFWQKHFGNDVIKAKWLSWAQSAEKLRSPYPGAESMD